HYAARRRCSRMAALLHQNVQRPREDQMWTIQRTAAVMVVALTAAARFLSAGVAQPTVKIITEQFMIDSGDPAIKLYVRNKRPEHFLQFTSEHTFLFVHGP